MAGKEFHMKIGLVIVCLLDGILWILWFMGLGNFGSGDERIVYDCLAFVFEIDACCGYSEVIQWNYGLVPDLLCLERKFCVCIYSAFYGNFGESDLLIDNLTLINN